MEMDLTKKNQDVSYFCMHFQMFTILWRVITSHNMNNMNDLKIRNLEKIHWSLQFNDSSKIINYSDIHRSLNIHDSMEIDNSIEIQNLWRIIY